MDIAIYLAAALVVAVTLYPVAWLLVHTYLEFRGARVVTCPETKEFAAVEVNAKRAALSCLAGQPSLRLSDCSRWPERAPCGQECLRQIEQAPGDCLLRNVLERWYAGKRCVYCGRGLDHIDWLEHKPALLSPDGRTLEWQEIRAEKVPAALDSHRPVCWNCHIAQTFRRLHADLVVERPSREHVRR
jgi:hypothetical protein